MKKYVILSFLFLLAVSPAMAKEMAPEVSTNGQNGVTVFPSRTTSSPSGQTVKNEKLVQTQNKGEDQQLSVKTQESEQLNQDVTQSFTKVSDQVHQLIDSVGGAKGGIGESVRVIAQSQTKLQDEIKSGVTQLDSRGGISKFLIGSDKKLIRSLEQKMEQNQSMIQQLEQLKLQTKNAGDLQQLQETIDLMTYQNTSLQNKVNSENKVKGLFGWLVNLFNK